jgi:putative DNA primase/helicase
MKRWADDEHISGVGFVLGDGIIGVDLDGCIDADGTLHEIARDAIALGTYTERSPGGRGVHLFVRAAISRPRKVSARGGTPGRELYDGRKGSARYFTVTGDRLGEVSEIRSGPMAQAALDAFVAKWFPEDSEVAAPDVGSRSDNLELLDDESVLRALFAETDGPKWRRLYDGDWSGYPSQSEADLALLRKLRFYTRADAAQMDRLFRRSRLMRPKWDERRGEETYGERTIAKALATGGRLYRGSCATYVAGAAEGRYGKVHESVMPVLARMTRTDILTYIGVAIHANSAGECFPSAATVAALFDSTREHVQGSIGKLGCAGLLPATKRPGASSKFCLPAYRGVSKFDTGGERPHGQSSAQKATHVEKRRKQRRRARPVSGLDTPPVSNFDPQTDKEQSIDTGERAAGVSKNEETESDRKILTFPKPCIPLSASARRLRDDMLRGPVGRLFLRQPYVPPGLLLPRDR